MPLAYPTFDRTEYACLNQNLSCVDAVIEMKQCDKDIRMLEGQLEDAKLARNTHGKGLLNLLIEDMKVFDQQERSRNKDRIEQYRKVIGRQRTPLNEKERFRIAENIYKEFAKLDAKAFEEFFKAEYPDEIAESAEQTKEVQKYRGKLLNTKQRRERLLADAVETIYRDKCPESFRSFRLSDDCTPVQMTELILTCFEKDWRDRVQMFEVPTTVSGIGIHTLDADRRQVWFTAFQKLGLDRIKRKPVFQYLVAPKEMEIFAGPRVLREIADNSESNG